MDKGIPFDIKSKPKLSDAELGKALNAIHMGQIFNYGKPMYAGTVSRVEVAKRRAKNKAAKRARKANR